jgi:TrmH family RNA methyltransferase
VITSTTNPQVKYIRSLITDRRTRSREQRFVVEGVRLLSEALTARATLHSALYAPAQLATSSAGQCLLDHLKQQPDCREATERVVAAATDTVSPQGVVAVVECPTLPPTPGLWLVLDDVSDPGNVGTLLRSAEAVGVGLVLCSRGTADPYSPKVVRSAMGAHFYVPLRAALEWSDIADALRGTERAYAAAAEANLPYDTADWRSPAALIVGSEAHGISAEGAACATSLVAIPMQGHIGSLNAAVAGSVILFEALRQQRSDRIQQG